MRLTILAATILASVTTIAFAQTNGSNRVKSAIDDANTVKRTEAQPGKGKSRAHAPGKPPVVGARKEQGRTFEASRSPDVRGAQTDGSGHRTTGTSLSTAQAGKGKDKPAGDAKQ